MTKLKIEVIDDKEVDFIHRFRNFGEDVYRALRDTCEVSIEEIDRARNSFEVRNIRSRQIGRVTQTIEKLFEKHYFSNSGIITKIKTAED